MYIQLAYTKIYFSVYSVNTYAHTLDMIWARQIPKANCIDSPNVLPYQFNTFRILQSSKGFRCVRDGFHPTTPKLFSGSCGAIVSTLTPSKWRPAMTLGTMLETCQYPTTWENRNMQFADVLISKCVNQVAEHWYTCQQTYTHMGVNPYMQKNKTHTSSDQLHMCRKNMLMWMKATLSGLEETG